MCIAQSQSQMFMSLKFFGQFLKIKGHIEWGCIEQMFCCVSPSLHWGVKDQPVIRIAPLCGSGMLRPWGEAEREEGEEGREVLNVVRLWAYCSWPEDMCIDLRERNQPAASRTYPNQGLNPWPRYVLWSGIKLTTLMVYSHPAGAQHIILDHSLYPVTCFSQSEPDTGMFFSNNSFKCNSALQIVFEDCWSSFIAYLLSVYAPGPVIGYWGYGKKKLYFLF